MTSTKLILLHGALGSEKQLEPLKKILKDKYKVYTFNFEGHGGRPTDNAFSIELFTDNLRAFYLKQKIDTANLFGYSMGGYVALNFTKKYPNLVNRIITLGTKFNWTKEVVEKEVRMLNPKVIEEKVPKFANTLKELHAPNDWKILLHKTAEMMSGLANGKKLNSDDLNQIAQKTQIGIGALDKMVSIEESRDAVNFLVDAQINVIKDFHHPIEKNNMNELAKIISNFIEAK